METFSDEQFKKLEEDIKRLHANQKLEEEIAEKDQGSQENEQTKAEEEREEKIRETLEECDKIILVLRETLDKKEISDWMQAGAILDYFEEKRQKAIEEQERLREQERLSQKYGPKNEGDIEEFEKIQKEEADMRRERSLVLLRSLLKEAIQENNSIKDLTGANLLEQVEKQLEVFRNRKKSL